MIIGLAGVSKSGKDTVGAYLVKEHKFERLAFADPLKKSVAALLDISFADVDRLKNNPSAAVCLIPVWSEDKEPTAEIGSWMRQFSFRELLQRYGTESHRGVFGYDFWVDQTLPVQGYYPGRAIVVTDVRFDNEVARIKQLGGVVWAIERDGLVSTDTHQSEILDFPIDCVVKNNGTFEELFTNVEEALSFSLATAGADG